MSAGSSRITNLLRLIVVLTVSVGWLTSAEAIDPQRVDYSRDASRLFWFVQITDTHITIGRELRVEKLRWAAEAAFEHMDAELVVHTGDITDHTNGGIFPLVDVECYPEEWAEYKFVLQDLANADNWYDLPGNHDHYGDADLSCYREWSIQGASSGQTQHVWSRQFSFGKYIFIGLATCGEDGARYPFDNANLTDEEFEFLESALTRHSDADLAFVFGHHPIPGFEYLRRGDRERFVELMVQHRVSSYGYGHTKYSSISHLGALLLVDLAPLRYDNGRDLALYTVDGNGVRVRIHDIGVWPIAQITAPLDAGSAGTHPFAYPIALDLISNPVRAVVFDPAGVLSVRFRLEDGPWLAMDRVVDHVFQGDWSTIGLDPGFHTLEIEALGGSGTAKDSIRVEVRTTECADGLDNNRNGLVDYPSDHGCASLGDDLEGYLILSRTESKKPVSRN